MVVLQEKLKDDQSQQDKSSEEHDYVYQLS